MLHNEPIPYIFEVWDIMEGDYFPVYYWNTRIHSMASKPYKLLFHKEEVEWQAKDRGILKELGGFVDWGDDERPCELHFEDFCNYRSQFKEQFEDFIFQLAKEQLNIPTVLKVEKLERGYAQLREELDDAKADEMHAVFDLKAFFLQQHKDYVDNLFLQVHPACNTVKYVKVVPSKA